MISLFFVVLGIIAFFEIIIRLIFNTSLFQSAKRELYVYVIGALFITLIILFIKPLLDISNSLFSFAVFFYAINIASCDNVTYKKIKSLKKRIVINIIYLIISGSLIFLLLPIIVPFI